MMKKQLLALHSALFAVLFILSGCASTALQPANSLQRRVSTLLAVSGLLRQAKIELNNGDFAAAMAALDAAEEFAPQDAKVVHARGSVYFRQGDEVAAAKAFYRAIELEPTFDLPYAHLALVEERRGNRIAAISLYQTAIRLQPLNVETRSNYAALLADDGQTELAYKELQKARALGGGTSRRNRAARINLRLGDNSDPSGKPGTTN